MPNSSSNSNRAADSAGGSTSASLIQRLQQNDVPAWSDLVHIYSPLIYHWCKRQGLADQDCADVVQEVFRSVVTNIKKFRKSAPGDTFRGWLRVVTRNKILDHFRRSGRELDGAGGTAAQIRLAQTPDLDDDLSWDQEELQAEHAVFLRAIEIIRKDFKEQTWQAFWLVVIEGKTAQEAADELGMRPGTVRVAKSRVLKRLREQLADVF